MSLLSRVLITIIYADIFEYPLKEEELYRWMVTDKVISRKKIKDTVRLLIKKHRVIQDGEYIAFANHKKNIQKRLRRSDETSYKIAHACRGVQLLRYIPTIECIGLTGAVAMGNGEKKDDIDFLIITTSRCVWITRLLATFLLDIVTMRRRPHDRNVTNKICLNMFLSENNMTVPKEEQDLYTAHEVLQMIPLWDNHATYKKFIRNNAWVSQYLYHAWSEKKKLLQVRVRSKHIAAMKVWSIYFLRFFETLVQMLQRFYMKKNRTHEVISPSVIRFHPHDARQWIKKKFYQRAQDLNVPLDKNFFRP